MFYLACPSRGQQRWPAKILRWCGLSGGLGKVRVNLADKRFSCTYTSHTFAVRGTRRVSLYLVHCEASRSLTNGWCQGCRGPKMGEHSIWQLWHLRILQMDTNYYWKCQCFWILVWIARIQHKNVTSCVCASVCKWGTHYFHFCSFVLYMSIRCCASCWGLWWGIRLMGSLSLSSALPHCGRESGNHGVVGLGIETGEMEYSRIVRRGQDRLPGGDEVQAEIWRGREGLAKQANPAGRWQGKEGKDSWLREGVTPAVAKRQVRPGHLRPCGKQSPFVFVIET